MTTLQDKHGPLYDAEEKAMRIAYAYSKDHQSAAELVQSICDGIVLERTAELLEALKGLVEFMRIDPEAVFAKPTSSRRMNLTNWVNAAQAVIAKAEGRQ